MDEEKNIPVEEFPQDVENIEAMEMTPESVEELSNGFDPEVDTEVEAAR